MAVVPSSGNAYYAPWGVRPQLAFKSYTAAAATAGRAIATSHNCNGYWCYGHVWCNRRLPSQDCVSCLQIADAKLGSKCPFPKRVMMGLMECGLKIDYQSFNDE